MNLTGREIIIFILENELEDVDVIDQDGNLAGFLSIEKAAVKFNVGVETVKAWAKLGKIKNICFNGEFYIPKNAIPNSHNI